MQDWGTIILLSLSSESSIHPASRLRGRKLFLLGFGWRMFRCICSVEILTKEVLYYSSVCVNLLSVLFYS